jgi:hypothetical protein
MRLYVPHDFFRVPKEEVVKHIFKLIPDQGPSFFFVECSFLYLPKVAALFALHDMKLEASAEPVPLQIDSGGDDGRHMIYEGAWFCTILILAGTLCSQLKRSKRPTM